MRRSTLLAIAIVILLGLWLWSGSETPLQSADEAQDETTRSQQLMKVQYRDSVAEDIDRVVVVQGQLEPFRTIELRAETEGRITTVAVQKGKRVTTGALLLSIEPGERKARLAEAVSLKRQRESHLAGLKRLGKSNLSSENALREAEAELAAADARLASIQIDISRTQIRAPSPSVVNERHVEIGELVKHGDSVITLVDSQRLLATAQAPQLAAGSFKPGQTISITTASKQQLVGRITFISSVADEATRSFRIEAEIDNSDQRVAAGMSATLAIPTATVRAHFISPAHLTLGRGGEIGVYAIEEDNRVKFFPVQLLRNDADGTWITGLPDSLRIVTLGQGFLTEGQQVVPVTEATIQPATDSEEPAA